MNMLFKLQGNEVMAEPLDKIARFAFDWAEILCKPEHGCTAYHRAWAMIRLIEVNGALPAGKEFVQREVKAASRDGNVHVLISGGADSGVMALAVEGATANGLNIRITAVDRCRTSLEQMALYGAANDVQTDLIQCSLEQIPAGLEVDAVLGHTVLPFIPLSMRADVFKAWAGALRPEGLILLSQRLSFNNISKQATSKNEIQKRSARLRKILSEFNILPSFAAIDDIVSAAEAFWNRNSNSITVTESEIRSYARDAFLQIRDIVEPPASAIVSPAAFESFSVNGNRHEIVLQKF